MTRKSGIYSKRKYSNGGGASSGKYKRAKRRRHKLKSQIYRLKLINNYFLESEIEHSLNVNNKLNFPRYEFSTDIPEKYEDSYFCVLPINPDNVFVSWELSSNSPENKTITNRNYFLRLTKLSNTDKDSDILQEFSLPENKPEDNFEDIEEDYEPVEILIDEPKTTGHLHIQVPEPGEHYKVEIVLLTENEKQTVISELQTTDYQNNNSDSIFNCTTVIHANCITGRDQENIKSANTDTKKSVNHYYMGSAALQ